MLELLSDVNGQKGPKIKNITMKQKRKAEEKRKKEEVKRREEEARTERKKGECEAVATEEPADGDSFQIITCVFTCWQSDPILRYEIVLVVIVFRIR